LFLNEKLSKRLSIIFHNYNTMVNLPSFCVIQHPLFVLANINVWMVNTIHVDVQASGNKFYKLMPNIEYAKQHAFEHLLSFGGAYSNHIHALALSAQAYGLHSIGIIRGESVYAENPTLRDAKNAGMELVFVSRAEYRLRGEAVYLDNLQKRYRHAFIIPEGGSNALAVKGCRRLMQQINDSLSVDSVAVACGTGGTFAGLVTGVKPTQTVFGFSVLKDASLASRVAGYLQQAKGGQDSADLTRSTNSYQIVDAAYGGYAKLDVELLDFIMAWLEQTGILLDPIYTSKMCKRLFEIIRAGDIKPHTNLAIVHSGGLQAWRGMKDRVIRLKGEGFWRRIEALL
jgi:1-aminocyclopropane-1-carboxylate deaminase/D-cysteine desulfhydrase-like pyridoxal-dependent ACC family enzyme